MTLTGAEDLELSSRLAKLGCMVFTPDALVLHNHERGLKDFAKQAYRYGGWRRESKVWDLQVIPPIIVPLLLLSLIFTKWAFLGAVVLYLIAVIGMAVKIATEERNTVYLASIPVAYVAQHLFYIIGFWSQTVKPRKTGVPWKK